MSTRNVPTHECPAPGCTKQVKQTQLCCSRHWFSLPQDIRSRVWSGYRGRDHELHARAMQDAIEFLNAAAVTA